MKGSGFTNAIEKIYGVNIIKHIISEKAISKPFKGYFLLSSALALKLKKQVIPKVHESKRRKLKLCWTLRPPSQYQQISILNNYLLFIFT